MTAGPLLVSPSVNTSFIRVANSLSDFKVEYYESLDLSYVIKRIMEGFLPNGEDMDLTEQNDGLSIIDFMNRLCYRLY